MAIAYFIERKRHNVNRRERRGAEGGEEGLDLNNQQIPGPGGKIDLSGQIAKIGAVGD
jgi:hypothetical protein